MLLSLCIQVDDDDKEGEKEKRQIAEMLIKCVKWRDQRVQLASEQQFQENETKARDEEVVAYLDSDLVPVGLGLMADAIQQLVQAQIVVVQVRSILHGRFTDLRRIH